jgi:conserved oligomeric Golgi complex subunit 3
VRGHEFSEMLSRLDASLEYVQKHLTHHDAPTYRSRYRLLLTRALTLIRNHFVNALKDVSADVAKRIADRQLNDTTMSTLLYAKFRVGAADLKKIGSEIQRRAVLPDGAEPGAEAEYQSLMNELFQNYAAARGRLVIPVIRKKINDISMAPSTSKDLVGFARSAIGYMRGVCMDEFELWGEWFASDDGLYQFLEGLCEPLYDHLRPRILREAKLVKLCEMCTLLQQRYMRDVEEDHETGESQQLDFSILIQPALEDAQSRLVFRTQAFLRDEIENFKPKPEDLEAPNQGSLATSGTKRTGPVTSGRKTSVTSPLESPAPKTPRIVDADADVNGDVDDKFQFSNSHSTHWYPTLTKAIWLLSRIYHLVNVRHESPLKKEALG